MLQFALEGLKGEDRERGGRNAELGAWVDFTAQVITEEIVDVVDDSQG